MVKENSSLCITIVSSIQDHCDLEFVPMNIVGIRFESTQITQYK